MQCGPGVLRGRGIVARFVSLQTLGGGGLELPDTWAFSYYSIIPMFVCLKIMLKWLVG